MPNPSMDRCDRAAKQKACLCFLGSSLIRPGRTDLSRQRLRSGERQRESERRGGEGEGSCAFATVCVPCFDRCLLISYRLASSRIISRPLLDRLLTPFSAFRHFVIPCCRPRHSRLALLALLVLLAILFRFSSTPQPIKWSAGSSHARPWSGPSIHPYGATRWER